MEPKGNTLVAWMEDLYTAKVKGPVTTPMNEWKIIQKENDKETDIVTTTTFSNGVLIFQVEEPFLAGKRYEVRGPAKQSAHLLSGKAVRTPLFDKLYAYSGTDLGAVCTNNATHFAVWAPTAEEVMLMIYERDKTNPKDSIPMQRSERGVWRIKLTGCQHGLRYTYKVFVNGMWQESLDPYASSSTLNGQHSVVINWEKLDGKARNPVQPPPMGQKTDAIIYEVHVRDFTAHLYSGVRNKGKYLGWTEKGKTPEGYSTTIPYLKEMGVTHIQLLPVQDFGSVDELKNSPAYNWGYDPIHHFVPEGSYAVNKSQPESRIIELRQLIDTLHCEGLRVVLDVVFNHFYVRENASLEKLVPGYYFRYGNDDLPADGTGVGNDTASERTMMKKYIIDCLLHWLNNYEVDGFRFDLMGIHDVHTMKEAAFVLHQKKPSLLLYGEGWNMHTPLEENQKATIEQASQLGGKIGFFNDRFRDAVKGHLSGSNGFIHANQDCENLDNIAFYMRGSIDWSSRQREGIFVDASQSINYVECHDNYTLWDQLKIRDDFSKEERIKMHRLATTMVLTAQGIPFLHAGQEFFRTKFGVENSYNAPVWINQIDWERRELFHSNIEYVKGLIQIRKRFEAFRLQNAAEISKRFERLEAPKDTLFFKLHKNKKENNLYVILNASRQSAAVPLPDVGIYQVIVDDERASLIPLKAVHSNRIEVRPISAMILYK
ncbi:type I pullulanase [Alteribacillus bidgolensis]|uniref:Pullulanase n=1 Tax=Alteribacillus bidgolensis TaxID=930129 RepID=A0A1G8EQZ7_9BACI|nr:type I pullulanase [Alteribacillus bidgolensis]SDH72272.1 pullulanase [Alteribacillus bidgolensis]